MLKSSLCEYSDTYIHEKGIIKITGKRDNARAVQTDERNKWE